MTDNAPGPDVPTEIRQYLAELGLTQRRLAMLIGEDSAYVRAIIRGQAKPPPGLMPWLRAVIWAVRACPPVPSYQRDPARSPHAAAFAFVWTPTTPRVREDEHRTAIWETPDE